MIYRRIAQTRVYTEKEPVPAGAGFGAYVVTVTGGALPDEMLPEHAWNDPALTGWFLFLPHVIDIADLPKFAAAVEASGHFPLPEHTSFAWLTFSDDVLSTPDVVRLRHAGTTLVVQDDATLTLGRYGFVLHEGTIVSTRSVPDGTVFVFQYPPVGGAQLPGARAVEVPMQGDGRFCLEGEGLIADFSDGPTGWDVALRFFAGEGESLRTFRYPVFEPFTAGEHAIVQIRWDPLTRWWEPDPTRPARTIVAFTGQALALVQMPGASPDWSLAPAPAMVFRSCYRTIFGDAVCLRPIVGSARLVLQPMATGPLREWYAVPAGEFALQLPAGPNRKRQRLLCGLAGTEFVEFTTAIDTQASDVLTFEPTRPAFAKGFKIASLAGRSDRALALADTLLDREYVTAWISASRQSAASTPDPVYFAQPGRAPLYSPSATAPDRVLPLFDAPAAILTPPSPAFPAVPYAGLTSADERPLLERLEREVLSPVRRTQTAQPSVASTRPLAGGPTITTTPQGFLAEINGTTWNWVQLAANRRSDGDEQVLRFDAVSKALREALQSNELFLVITDPTEIASFRHLISIADWPFDIDVGSGGDPVKGEFRNVLLFKFGTGSVLDRVNDLATWSTPNAFNRDPALVQAWLRNYISSANQQKENAPQLALFVDRMTNASWEGVMALAVSVELTEFPDDIKGLLGGIDLSQFLAHHVGVEISRVDADGATLSMPGTSLFGLINYVDKDLPPTAGARRDRIIADPIAAPSDEGYGFRVLTLMVVFENSAITDFASRIVVTITRLFGEDAARNDDQPIAILKNTVELRGRYEEHGGVPYYVFVGEQPVRFLMEQSHIFHYVEMIKAQFHTLQAATPGATTVDSRFSFYGFLSFRTIGGVDVFSFGDPDGAVGGSRLFFSNLSIDMRFSLPEDVDDQPAPAFSFNVSLVSFDLGQSKARQGSLFDGFPMKLSGIETGTGDRTPAAAGYLPVLTPFENAAALDTRWYGLSCGLNLGSLGALAAQAGFTAQLLTAWSPGGKEPRVALMIRLPGTGAGKTELSIENVLKLAIGQIRLSQYERGTGKAFQLVLSNIGLSFLGKTLPSSAFMEVALFGDPDVAKDGGNLGWYGVWSKAPPTAQLTD